MSGGGVWIYPGKWQIKKISRCRSGIIPGYKWDFNISSGGTRVQIVITRLC